MPIKVVVVDSARLPERVEFPPLGAEKYSWEQYPALSGEEIADRCWRADILISLGSSTDRAILESLQPLKLVIAADDASSTLDQAAPREKGIEVLVFTDFNCADPADARDLCAGIVRAIDHYIKDQKA